MPFWRERTGRSVLAITGVFYLYLALLDQTMYQWIAEVSPALVAAGTFASSLVPTVFAFAALKQGLFPGANALARYESLVRSSWFWYLGGIIGIMIGFWPTYLKGSVGEPLVIVSVVLGLALALYGRSIRRRRASWTSAW
jgi:hypothetical protein